MYIPQNSAAFLLILIWLNQLKIFPYEVSLHSGKKKNRKELNLKNCLHCLECDIAFKLCGKSKSENAHSTGNTCCAVLMWHNDKEKVMLQYCILMNP